MRFKLQEWNLIYEAIRNEYDKVTKQLNEARERNDETRLLLDKKITLCDILEKLEHDNI